MILCCRILIISIITALMYFIIMIQVSSIDKLNNKICDLENDMQYIMESFNKRGRESDESVSEGAVSYSKSNKNLQNCPKETDDKSLSDDDSYKDLERLKNEVLEIKETLERLVGTLNKTGLHFSSQKPPINLATEALGTKILYVEDQQRYSFFDCFLSSIFGILKSTNSPRNILVPSVDPGNCYGFHGTTSKIMIKLQRKTIIESVSIEHIPQHMSPWGNITNAPKDFTVHASNCSETEELRFLGAFQYQISTQQTLQYFCVTEQEHSFQCVQFTFLTNHGDASHTCIYRVGVHGKFTRD